MLLSSSFISPLLLWVILTLSPLKVSANLPTTTPERNTSNSHLKSRAGSLRVMARYRLWEWLNTQDVAVDFVGPFVGTRPPDTAQAPAPPALQGAPAPPSSPPITTGGYAVGVDSNFDSDHFGAWGRQLAQDQDLIKEMVSTYDPDYLLVLLGFNDMGWFISDAEGKLYISRYSFLEAVSHLTSSQPTIKFALGNVPQRTAIGGREDLPIKTTQYNELLASAIPSWSSASSPIAPVLMQENYDCGINISTTCYDGLHPNVLGEYQIAQAFSSALVKYFQIGTSALVVPDTLPVRPLSIPTNFQAVASPDGITATWDAVYGAIGYDVQSALVGLDWSITEKSANRYDTTWVLEGQKYQYRVRMSNGDAVKSDWSSIVSATADPQTPAPPPNVLTEATASGVDVSWGAPSGDVTLYAVFIYDKDTTGAIVEEIGIELTIFSAHIDGLYPGHHYVVAVSAWNANGGGFPSVARGVTVGYGTPPIPTNLQITSVDATTIQMAWCGSPAAAGYRFWHRNINDATSVLFADNSSTSDTHYGVAYLIPGVWNYEFCISAYNGQLESGLSTCVTSPQPGNVAGGSVGGADCYAGGTAGGGDDGTTPSGGDGGAGEGGDSGGSGTGGDVIYLPPSMWTSPPANIGCNGSCTFIIPPSPLPVAETIHWPNLTTTLLSSSAGSTFTKTTTISVAAFIITEITYWSVTVGPDDPKSAMFVPEQSVTPPSFTWNLPPTEATFPPSQMPPYSDFQSVSTNSSQTIIPVFFSASHAITIQPQPTFLISTSTDNTRTAFTYSSTSDTASQPTCTSHCGSHNCGLFGCGTSCGFFGCGGGCGIFGCGGGCGILGCGLGCHSPFGCGSESRPLLDPECSNPGCVGGACPGAGLGDTDGDTDPDKTSKLSTSSISSSTESSCEVSTITMTTSACASCSTIQVRQVASACSPTTSTTSVVESCPIATALDPETDDQGDDEPIDGTETPPGTTTIITWAESAIFGGAIYTVLGRALTIGGGTYPVPIVTSATPIYIGTKQGVLIPAKTGPSFIVTASGVSIITPTNAPTAASSTVVTTSTSSFPVPTVTATSDPIYCFDQHGDGVVEAPYAMFNTTGANVVVSALCGSGLSLSVGADPLVKTYMDATGVNIIAQVSWAVNQNGCLTELAVPLSGESCLDALNLSLEQCDLGIELMRGGGAYILNGPSGCVEYLLYAEEGLYRSGTAADETNGGSVSAAS
ncbi:uncharacterized protein PAC_18349 [Phialocephala subalpina]|uniref:Fibronectin type-III domain-containing protein n=1 Tax=Phialocephala subalpina TaxID=576137 RepID=A0A1L7XTV2_9HELO|nr:uncharacterized protein PAC_18349 [Phialocephala subalpina]